MTYEYFVTYEQAVMLKQLRFDGYCNHYYDVNTKKLEAIEWIDYDGDVDADCLYDNNPTPGVITDRIMCPTLAQVQNWLREVKGIDVNSHCVNKQWTYSCGKIGSQQMYEKEFATPREALSAGIDTVIKLLNKVSVVSEQVTAAEKLRNMAHWIDYMDEHFNDCMTSIQMIEQVYDACEEAGLEFADSLDWADADDSDEEYRLAKKVNEILGCKYYDV